MFVQILFPLRRKFGIHNNTVQICKRGNAGEGNIIQFGVIDHKIFLFGVGKGQLMKDCRIVTGIGDPGFHVYASTGNESFIEKILPQTALGTAALEAFGSLGIFPADEKQMDGLGGGKNIGYFK